MREKEDYCNKYKNNLELTSDISDNNKPNQDKSSFDEEEKAIRENKEKKKRI